MITLIQKDLITQVSFEDLLSESSYTLLYFYPKNDTPWCTREAQDFTRLAKDFANKDIQIIGVSKDKAESHCKFIEKYALAPRYIADPDLELHAKFSTRWEKNNYGKIVMGVIRSTFLIDSAWDIVHERRSIRATGHAERVKKWVTENL